MWMKSKSGMWHKKGAFAFGDQLPKCQSYNLDRPNPLNGEEVKELPEGSKVCKKCSGKSSGAKWEYMGVKTTKQEESEGLKVYNGIRETSSGF